MKFTPTTYAKGRRVLINFPTVGQIFYYKGRPIAVYHIESKTLYCRENKDRDFLEYSSLSGRAKKVIQTTPEKLRTFEFEFFQKAVSSELDKRLGVHEKK